MESNERKKMIQQGFDTVAAGYELPTLSFFPKTQRFLFKCLNFKHLHLKEIAGILGDTGVLVGIGERVRCSDQRQWLDNPTVTFKLIRVSDKIFYSGEFKIRAPILWVLNK